MGRRILQLLIAFAVFVLPLAATAAPARADNTTTLLALVNALRAAHGVGPLAADPALTRAAQNWSTHMASTGALVHNPNLSSEIPTGWDKIGENIGEGGAVSTVFTLFVNSPFHYSNMIDPTYTKTGIGVVVGARGTLWITQDFEAFPGGPLNTLPAPRVTPTTTTRPVGGGTPKATATTATTAAPTAAATTTPPPPATTATVPSVQGSESALPGGAAAPPETTVPRQFAAAAAARPASGHGVSWIWWALALTLVAIAAVGSGAVFVTKVR